jgi:hypothetical protein
VESVKGIRRQDLVRFDTYFRPNNALLSVSGDFEPGTILPLLAERFGAWRPKAVPPSRLPPFPKDGPRTVVTVDMPDSTQSQMALATRTISATHPDALALSTANVALGGLFTSRLNQQLREVRGWTYGMFSSVGFNKRTGVFQVRGSVVASHTVDSLQDIEAELRKYAAGDLTDAELAHAKEGILQSLPQAGDQRRGGKHLRHPVLHRTSAGLVCHPAGAPGSARPGRGLAGLARVPGSGEAAGGGGGTEEEPGGAGGAAARTRRRPHCRGEGPRHTAAAPVRARGSLS